MRLVTPVLKRIVYPCLASAGCLRDFGRGGLAVVTYHGVLPPSYKAIDPGFDGNLLTADAFRQQLRLLKTKYAVISPDEALRWCRGEAELPQRAALLTCDDGLLNNLTEMVPILQEEGLRCIFFITGQSLSEQRTLLWYQELLLLLLRAPAGSFKIQWEDNETAGILDGREQRRAVWWNVVKQLSGVDHEARKRFLAAAHDSFGLDDTLRFFLKTHPETERHFCLLTRKELWELASAGMTIGAHTMSHPILSQLPDELAWGEITESRNHLESALGQSIWAFAYPFGDEASVTPRILSMTREAGFEASFMNIGGGLGTQLPVHAMPRVHVNAGMSASEFEAHVGGFYEFLQRQIRRPAPHVSPKAPDAGLDRVPLRVPSTI
jgi:peptidoglycan/xylan/chitin deacetylase (PgdA/CDA1 family)